MVRQASAESVPMSDTFPITSSPMPSPSPSRSSITSTPTARCTFLTMPVRFCLGVPGRPVIIDHVVERRVLLLPGLADSLLDKAEMCSPAPLVYKCQWSRKCCSTALTGHRHAEPMPGSLAQGERWAEFVNQKRFELVPSC